LCYYNTKKTRNMSQRQAKDSAKKWKAKAVDYKKENEKLHRQNKELVKSRNGWKSKCKELKVKLSKGLSKDKKAKGHHYSLSTVNFLMELYRYGGMSLRSCQHVLICLNRYLGLDQKIPSHNTLRNWLCKCGMNRVESVSHQSGDYVVFVDESINFGCEKILLFLGIPESEIPKNRSLCHSDMEVLHMGVSQEWKGDQIARELEKIAVNKTIKYVVSDEGTNLKKAYKLLDLTHIEDCTHILANHLKKLYAKDEGFLEFSKLIGKLRQKWNLSKNNSEYMPPGMRGKMRFANIFPCVNWAKKMLDKRDDLPLEVQKELVFLKINEQLITSLIQVSSIFKTVCEDLKNKGFGLIQKQLIFDKLKTIQSQTPEGLAPKAVIFLENSKGYLENLTAKSKELAQDFVLCSSDIIESYFGKFKTKINSNSRSGLTEFIFTMATFGKHFSVDETKNALENIKCKQLRLVKRPPKAA
jgi:hypothetical protein